MPRRSGGRSVGGDRFPVREMPAMTRFPSAPSVRHTSVVVRCSARGSWTVEAGGEALSRAHQRDRGAGRRAAPGALGRPTATCSCATAITARTMCRWSGGRCRVRPLAEVAYPAQREVDSPCGRPICTCARCAPTTRRRCWRFSSAPPRGLGLRFFGAGVNLGNAARAPLESTTPTATA